MAVAMTYTSLLLDLRRYLERGTVTDQEVFEQLPSLINLAERTIATRIKVQGFINNVTDVMAAGQSVYGKPDRWRETISMEIGTGLLGNDRVIIYPRSYEYLRTYWPNSDSRALPQFYADYNYNFWLIAPTPIAIYPWQVNYYQQPPYLEDSNQTNWLSLYAPNALLYRALLEATPFLKNDERIPVWESMYEKWVDMLDKTDLQKIVDRTTTRREA